MPADEVLHVMERVADWQLDNPCSVDLRWKKPGKDGIQHMRIGWDGTILRSRVLNETAPVSELPHKGWRTMVRLERGGVAFEQLPEAVRTAWLRESGVEPAALTRIELLNEDASRGWEMAALYHGMLALGHVSKKPVYREALSEIAEANHWTLGSRIYHADDLCVGYLYLDFYEESKDVRMLGNVQARIDWLMRHPSAQPMDIRKGQERWTWCDALFMAPPVWLRLANITGDHTYLEFMDREWRATTEHLYAPSDKLFYRDANFFSRREPNGEKVFWSRGNAWVIASLALMLEDMPKDFAGREYYVRLFQDMAGRIAQLQPSDGLWRSSLLDTAANPHPESSSSAFFCYALARGINLGLLDSNKYLPVVVKTWAALQRCVSENGHLGFVQQPGAAPGSANADSTAPYGVGAFLMAGAEVYKLSRNLPPVTNGQ